MEVKSWDKANGVITNFYILKNLDISEKNDFIYDKVCFEVYLEGNIYKIMEDIENQEIYSLGIGDLVEIRKETLIAEDYEEYADFLNEFVEFNYYNLNVDERIAIYNKITCSEEEFNNKEIELIRYRIIF